MKKIIFILFCCLYINSLKCQEIDISKINWETIVDYANAKVTFYYLESLYNDNILNEEDKQDYLNKIKPNLYSRNIDDLLPYDSLQSLLKPQFEKTSNKLSFKINEIKSGSRELDSLFVGLKIALSNVEKESLLDTEPISKLKKELNEHIQNLKKPVSQKINQAVVLKETNTSLERRNNINILPNLIIVILFITSVFFIVRSYKKGKKIEKLKSQIKKLNTSTIKEQGNEKNPYKEQNQRLKNQIAELNEELTKARENSAKNLDSHYEFSENQESNTKTWDAPNPAEVKPIQTSFYASKPNPNRIFPKTTQEISEQETVFRFDYVDKTKTIAEFQVILVSDFMKRQIVNSPDDFLYRVCNNANSNQEFQRNIITERKGLARLKNGNWVVDDNDKAFIKFQ